MLQYGESEGPGDWLTNEAREIGYNAINIKINYLQNMFTFQVGNKWVLYVIQIEWQQFEWRMVKIEIKLFLTMHDLGKVFCDINWSNWSNNILLYLM